MKRSGNKTVAVILSMATTLLILFLLTSCYSSSKAKPVEETPGEPPVRVENAPPEQKLNLVVYYVKMTENDAYLVREIHQVPHTVEVAKAALEELINVDPTTPGAMRVLPPATKIRGITIRDGLATIDFSREVLKANVGASGEGLGIQSIANTLTELPGIQKVTFLVEGKLNQEARDWWGHVGLYDQPFSKDLSKVYEPAAWVIQPEPGRKISSPLEVRVSVKVLEGTVNVRLVDNVGQLVAEASKTTDLSTTSRGEFVISMPFNAASPGQGALEVVWKSQKDDKIMDKVAVPVTW